jgi:hypothetical protein
MPQSEKMDLELAEGRVGGRLTSGLGTLAEHLGGLVATDASTPLTTVLLVLVGATRQIKIWRSGSK